MSPAAELAAPDQVRLTGSIGFENFRVIKAEAEARVAEAQADALEVDCSGLEVANSLCVALLMALLRVANRRNRQVRFTGVAPALAGIIEFSGMSEVLLNHA